MEFNAPRAAMAIDRADLELPVGEHNEELHALAVDYLNVHFPARHTSLPVQVRTVIERLLGTGACGYAEVADALSMHPRTLQRASAGRGHHLRGHQGRGPTGSGSAVSGPSRRAPRSGQTLLDYSEQSALTRSCQRWFHTTPRALRANLTSPTAASA